MFKFLPYMPTVYFVGSLMDRIGPPEFARLPGFILPAVGAICLLLGRGLPMRQID